MQFLNNLTDNADQIVTIVLPDKSVATMELVYRPSIQRWSMNLTHPLLTINGYTLCQDPNILRPWKNVISFGIAITSANGVDPMNIEDFVNGNCSVYILSAAEVQQVETDILAPIPLVNA